MGNGTVQYLIGSTQDSGEQSPGMAKIRYPAEMACIPEGIVIAGGSQLSLSFEVPEGGEGFMVTLNESEVLPLDVRGSG
jgi:hypothetical protein